MMNREEARDLAEEAAERAVHKMMTALGVDTSSPEAFIAAQGDFRFLRRCREAAETAKSKALKTTVGLMVAAAFGWLIVSFGWQQPAH